MFIKITQVLKQVSLQETRFPITLFSIVLFYFFIFFHNLTKISDKFQFSQLNKELPFSIILYIFAFGEYVICIEKGSFSLHNGYKTDRLPTQAP